MRELLASLDKGLPINTGKITISDWLDKWIDEHVAPKRRQETVERYRDICRKHIKPHLGHVQMTRLTPTDIKALEATWASQGMSPIGILYAHRVLSAALKAAVKMELLYRNPAQVVDPPSPEKREVRPPDVSAVNRILNESEQHADQLHPALRLVAYTGIRRGECLGLHWNEVDLNRPEITITESLVRSAELGLILEPPKSRSGRRVINLDDGTAQILREHKVRQMEHRLVLGSTYVDNDLVFPDEFGAPLNPMALTRALQRAARQADAGHVNCTT
jgi:integrase